MRIVYIDIDSLRPDHLGCYGYERPTSPTIDNIAAQGIRFDNYYCADSPCMPSRHGWMTGRFGINHNVVTHGGPTSKPQILEQQYGGPDARNQLLQLVLRQQGYDSICFSNFPTRHCATWFSLGWSELHSPNLKNGSETADEVNTAVLKWIKDNHGRDNFFLYINYWDPHRVYEAPTSWFNHMKENPNVVNWPNTDAIQQHQDLEGWFTASHLFPYDKPSPTPNMPEAIKKPEDLHHLINGYDTEIKYTDHHIQQIMDALGDLKDTAIIISADHGEAMGEHGIYGDHVCADECIHRIPLIIKWPDLTLPGSSCNDLLYNVDLSATLIELIGGELPEYYDGRSFASGLKTGSCKLHDYLVWGHGLYTVQRAVRTPTHLMIRTYDAYGYDFDPIALYDMRSDYYQTNNIFQEQSEIQSEMDNCLSEWVQEQHAKPYALTDPFEILLKDRQSS